MCECMRVSVRAWSLCVWFVCMRVWFRFSVERKLLRTKVRKPMTLLDQPLVQVASGPGPMSPRERTCGLSASWGLESHDKVILNPPPKCTSGRTLRNNNRQFGFHSIEYSAQNCRGKNVFAQRVNVFAASNENNDSTRGVRLRPTDSH